MTYENLKRAKRRLFNKHVETTDEVANRKVNKLKQIQRQLLEGTELKVDEVASSYENYNDNAKYMQIAKCITPYKDDKFVNSFMEKIKA